MNKYTSTQGTWITTKLNFGSIFPIRTRNSEMCWRVSKNNNNNGPRKDLQLKQFKDRQMHNVCYFTWCPQIVFNNKHTHENVSRYQLKHCGPTKIMSVHGIPFCTPVKHRKLENAYNRTKQNFEDKSHSILKVWCHTFEYITRNILKLNSHFCLPWIQCFPSLKYKWDTWIRNWLWL